MDERSAYTVVLDKVSVVVNVMLYTEGPAVIENIRHLQTFLKEGNIGIQSLCLP